MKKIFLFASAIVFSMAVMAQTTPATPLKADDVAKFNTEKHDFGKIKQGVPVIYFFEITNISDKPLVVENASASCGCTIPEKPEKPINPGATAKIKVQYNAAAVQPFNKDVYIKLAGIDQQKVLHISGEVIAAEPVEAKKTTKQ
jgi:Protein of unknown function (DUF1573)